MASSAGKLAAIMVITVLLLAVAYLSGYLLVRQHRLSVEYVGSVMLFSSEEQVQQWLSEFQENRDATPLLYGDSIPLYLFFWPAIQIDSVVSGRGVDSPLGGVGSTFGIVEPYVVPSSSIPSLSVPVPDSDSQQTPADEAQHLPEDDTQKATTEE